jgi:hypothetical protein
MDTEEAMGVSNLIRPLSHLAIAMGITAIAGGCGTSSASPPTQPPQVGTVTIASTPSSFSTVQGGSASAGLTLTRGGGFGGDVALTASGAPPGMTVTISPATFTPSLTSGTITAAATATVPAAAYPIVVRASGISGQPTANTTLTVTVIRP